jgi:YbbR domain-containing protein
MRILTENLGWKLVSLVAAFCAWLGLAGQTEVATSVPAIVQYHNVPSELELSTENFDKLFLKVRGPFTRLTTAALTEVALKVDLANVGKPGEQTFSVGPDNLSLPPGVSLISVMPSQVRIRLEKRQTRTVPVDIRFAGPPAPGYRVVQQAVEPPSMRIVGPESKVDQITSVQTDAIDLSAKLGHAEFRVPVFVTDPQVRFETSTPIVTVRVSLEKIP